MHIRSVVVVNIALMGALVFMDTGCRTKAGGWRWPWQSDPSTLAGGTGLNDPTTLENTDLSKVTDAAGNLVSGARFEDTMQAVQGVKFAPVYFAFCHRCMTSAPPLYDLSSLSHPTHRARTRLPLPRGPRSPRLARASRDI